MPSPFNGAICVSVWAVTHLKGRRIEGSAGLRVAMNEGEARQGGRAVPGSVSSQNKGASGGKGGGSKRAGSEGGVRKGGKK